MTMPWERYSAPRLINDDVNVWLQSGPWARYIKPGRFGNARPGRASGGLMDDGPRGNDVDQSAGGSTGGQDDGTGPTGLGNVMGTGDLDIGGRSLANIGGSIVGGLIGGLPGSMVGGWAGDKLAGVVSGGDRSTPYGGATADAANPMQQDPAQRGESAASNHGAVDVGQVGTGGPTSPDVDARDGFDVDDHDVFG